MCTTRESTEEAASSIGSILDALVSSCRQVKKVKTRATTKRAKNTSERIKSAKKTSDGRSVRHPTKKRKRRRTYGSNDYLPRVSKGGSGRRFTEAEDRALIEAFNNTEKIVGGGNHGHTNWKAIAKNFPGKTAQQCKKRYSGYLRNGVEKKSQWTVDEDRILLDGVKNTPKYAVGTNTAGLTNWKVISKLLDGRSPVRCRDRYKTLLRRNRKAVTSAVSTPVEDKKWTRQSQTTTPQISGEKNTTAAFETPLGVRSRRTICTKLEERIVSETNINRDEKVICID